MTSSSSITAPFSGSQMWEVTGMLWMEGAAGWGEQEGTARSASEARRPWPVCSLAAHTTPSQAPTRVPVHTVPVSGGREGLVVAPLPEAVALLLAGDDLGQLCVQRGGGAGAEAGWAGQQQKSQGWLVAPSDFGQLSKREGALTGCLRHSGGCAADVARSSGSPPHLQ